MHRKVLLFLVCLLPLSTYAQFNTDRLLTIGRSALYYEDYVLSIQYFNKVISIKPYLYEPWFYRAVAKYNLEDFAGAENDCSQAVERNPYVTNVYELRGLTRVMQGKFKDAISDYNKALRYSPENRSLWHNKILCKINSKDYPGAHNDLDTMLIKWRGYAKGYSMRGEVFLLQEDTTAALTALNKSTELDPYDASTWATRAIISLGQQQWAESDTLLTEAIRLLPKQSAFYVNRALARININNLRGAMSDYDMAIDLDPNSFLGHYNRGLLRAQVGDDNRAITDFDFVIKKEPENYLALYNRAILREKVGNLQGAIDDYSAVLDEYPSFWAGLQSRASCYRKLGRTLEAEKDEFKVLKEQLHARRYGSQPRLDKKKQRKRSETNPDKYNQLVVADEQSVEHEYASDYRGHVQNRRADMSFMPMFELTFRKTNGGLGEHIAYDKCVAEYNDATRSGNQLYITNSIKHTEIDNSETLFELIEKLSVSINNNIDADDVKDKLIERAVAYTLINDFESAKEDATMVLHKDSANALAYWIRAVCQSRINDFNSSLGTDMAMMTANVLSDLSEAIRYNPNSPYLIYNRGVVYTTRKDFTHAIEDYDKAIEADDKLAAAYYNRGIAKILTDRLEEGIKDLSVAGELGLYNAYSIIKKYSKRQ